MSYKNIGGGSSLQGIVNDMNQNINELKNREVTEIFKDDTGTRRVLLGKGADDFYGMKVSKPGLDVYDASNDELIFNSNQNVFKIVKTGSSSIDATSATAGSTVTSTIPHGLSFIPIPWVFWNQTGNNYEALPTWSSYSASGGSVLFGGFFSYEVNDTNLVLQFLPGATSNYGVFNFTYYLLQETAN